MWRLLPRNSLSSQEQISERLLARPKSWRPVRWIVVTGQSRRTAQTRACPEIVVRGLRVRHDLVRAADAWLDQGICVVESIVRVEKNVRPPGFATWHVRQEAATTLI